MYQASSNIIQCVLEGKGDIKTILYKRNKVPNTAVYALTTQTLKYKNILDEIISATPDVSKQYNHKKNKAFRGLILVLTYDFLFGKNKSKLSSNSGRFTKLIINNKNALNSALVRIKIKKNVSNNKDLVQHNNFKDNCISNYIYARINTILINSNDMIAQLKHNHQFTLYKTEQDYKSTNSKNQKAFWHDKIIPNLLIFTHNCCPAKLELCIKGYLIIQNKSSCIPAFILNPNTDSYVLDACASPGNKTAHLINIISDNNNTYHLGKRQYVTALDYDKKRYNILKSRIKTFGMNAFVKVLHKDFLTIDPLSQFANKFNAILLDPSCSGSGLIKYRFGHYDENKQLKVPKFAEIQKKMVLHAMKFKNVNKIVYSTCSVNEEENEQVVEYVLRSCNNAFEVIKVFDEWEQKGIDKYEFSDSVLRINNDNQQDLHGFFVVCFQRKLVNKNDNNKRKLDGVMMVPVKRRKVNGNRWKVSMKRARSTVRKKWNK
eukprot:247815_1